LTQLTSSLIEGFAGSLLSKRYDGATATPECHKQWWELCTSSSPQVAIAAPRRHGKSTAVTHAYVLAAVLFRERKFVVIVSDTETQASLFLNDIKEELSNNEDLIELFGVKQLKKDTETDVIIEFTDGYTAKIMVRGAEQRVRGLKWPQKSVTLRPDLIVCDDLEGDEQVMNKDRREKFRKWFFGALLPCLSKTGICRVVGTVLHLDSLLNRLLPEDSSKSSILEPLRTYSINPRAPWKSVRYRAHDEDFSNILWPDMWSKEALQDVRQGFVDQGIPEVYSQEYLNYPIDEATSYFKRDDFLEIPKFELTAIKEREKALVYYAAVDFAISQGERSDFTVIAICGIDDKGLMYVVDIRRGRWDALQIVDEMFSVQRKYDPHLFITEKGAIEKAIGAILRSEMVKRNNYLNLYPMTPTKDKTARARSFQARLRGAGVKFDKTASWYPEYEDELVRFPKSRHDDQVDASSWLGLVIDQVHNAATLEEMAEEEYMEALKDSDNEGRSHVCGY
jgi:predicted phage terminase large subunit-like protein